MKKTAKISLIVIIFVAILISIFLVNIVYAKTNKIGKGLKECNDRIDNDGDGLIDLNDPGCSSRKDSSELGTNQCNDGLDNDGDGYIDLEDSECTSSSDNDESPRDFCNDSDDFNLFARGTVSGEDDSVSFSNTDFCLDSITVREYVCTGKGNDYDPSFIDVPCNETGNATSCSNGRCV